MKLIPLVNGDTYEWCPHCDCEVLLNYASQYCPSCGRIILACSACKNRSKSCTECTIKSSKFIED